MPCNIKVYSAHYSYRTFPLPLHRVPPCRRRETDPCYHLSRLNLPPITRPLVSKATNQKASRWVIWPIRRPPGVIITALLSYPLLSERPPVFPSDKGAQSDQVCCWISPPLIGPVISVLKERDPISPSSWKEREIMWHDMRLTLTSIWLALSFSFRVL